MDIVKIKIKNDTTGLVIDKHYYAIDGGKFYWLVQVTLGEEFSYVVSRRSTVELIEPQVQEETGCDTFNT